METTKKHKDLTVILAMISTYIITGGFGYIFTNALQAISDIFPEMEYMMIYRLQSIPTLVTFLATLALGSIIGKKIKYKACFSISLILILIGGIGPFFIIDNYTFLLICRIIVALGMAFGGFISGAYVLTFGTERGPKLLAMSGSIVTAFQFIISNVAGNLATVNVKYMFLLYVVSVIPLLLILLFYKNPELPSGKNNDTTEKTLKSKGGIPSSAFIYPLLMFIFFLVNSSCTTNLSFIVNDKNIGTVASVALISSMSAIGYTVGGLLYGKIYDVIKRYMLVVAMLMYGTYVAMLLLTSSLITFCIGSFCVGVAMSFSFPVMYKYVGAAVSAESFVFMSSLLMASAQLPGYVAPYYIQLCSYFFGGDMFYAPLKVGLGIYLLLAMSFLVKDFRPKTLKESEKK